MNKYKFLCPSEGAVVANDCSEIHRQMMVGNVRAVPSRCAVAHRAGKCVWAIMERRVWQARQPTPFSPVETEPHRVEPEIVNHALAAVVMPFHYGGICPTGTHDAHFANLSAPTGGKAPSKGDFRRPISRVSTPSTPQPKTVAAKQPVKPSRPLTVLDAISEAVEDRAAVVNRRLQEEASQNLKGASQTAESSVEAPKQPEKPKASTQAENGTAGNFSLADWAKQMAERRAKNG